MSLSDRAAAAAPFLQTALNDSEVQDVLRRAGRAGRGVYLRARGKSPSKALKDKRLRCRAQRAAIASWQLVAAMDAAQTRRRSRRGRRVIFALAVLAGTYGAYLVSNADGREALRGLISSRDASTHSSNAQ